VLTPKSIESVTEVAPISIPVVAPDTVDSADTADADTMTDSPFTPVIGAAEESEVVAMAASGGSSGGGSLTPWMLLVLTVGFSLRLFRRTSYIVKSLSR